MSDRYAGLAVVKKDGGSVAFDDHADNDQARVDEWEAPALHGKLWGKKSRKDGYIHGDEIRLSTGTVLYAYRGAIDISENLEAGGAEGDSLDHLTKAERQEVADYAISLWQRFKEANQE